MSDRVAIELDITLDGRPAVSDTSCIWAGPYVVVIATTLPEAGLAAELHSTFVGHAGVPRCATHLVLGPIGRSPSIVIAEHEHANPDPAVDVRECVYEHAQIMTETMGELGFEMGIGVTDTAFDGLERIER